jgi:protein gp37
VFGPKAPRRFLDESYWREPIVWNQRAIAERQRHRVFVSDTCDAFENRADLDPWRDKLIENTPCLDWLLLTKRPGLIRRLSPYRTWPKNVWLGVTAESQEWAERRIPKLLAQSASVHFVVCEPILGEVDLRPRLSQLTFVIAGPETNDASPEQAPEWLDALRRQCTAANIPFHRAPLQRRIRRLCREM